MLNKQQSHLIEQASAKAGGKLEFNIKKSTSRIVVYFIRASNRADARRNVQNHLKAQKVVVQERKTSLSSENITEFTLGNFTVRLVYKPISGGMTETT